MPVHFDALTEDYKNPSALAWLLQDGINACNSVFISPDQMYFHMQAPMLDALSQEEIGKIVYTVKRNDEMQTLEVLDLDFILSGKGHTGLLFLKKRHGSSDSNEYYDVEVTDEGQHLVIETVNRYTVPGEIEGSERGVRISVFPFELTVYKDIDDFNYRMGFRKMIAVADTGLKVGGLSERFAMPGDMVGKNGDNNFSFLVGTVQSYRDVQICLGDVTWNFVLADVVTGLGCVPVAIGRDVFDLSQLAPGVVVGMNADVKADLSKPEDFFYQEK